MIPVTQCEHPNAVFDDNGPSPVQCHCPDCGLTFTTDQDVAKVWKEKHFRVACTCSLFRLCEQGCVCGYEKQRGLK